MQFKVGTAIKEHSFPIYADSYQMHRRLSSKKIDEYLSTMNYSNEMVAAIREILMQIKVMVEGGTNQWVIELDENEVKLNGLPRNAAAALRNFKILIGSSVSEYGRSTTSNKLMFHNLWSYGGNSILLKRIAESEFHSPRKLESMLDSIQSNMIDDVELLDIKPEGFVTHA